MAYLKPGFGRIEMGVNVGSRIRWRFLDNSFDRHGSLFDLDWDPYSEEDYLDPIKV